MNRTAVKLLSRRRLLQSSAMLSLLAPVLRRMDDAQAQAASPRRVILLFSPNGPMAAAGPASGDETNFTFHDWWKPLERHRADGIFLSHMACTGAGVVDGGGHGLGGQTFGGHGAGADGNQYLQKGETIDQVIGKRLEAEGRAGVKRSLVWGNYKQSEAGGTGDAFAVGPGRNISPETDPQAAWAELFASFSSPDATPEAQARAAYLMANDRSILDHAFQDCQGLRSALGAEGAALLDDHCTTVRAMEQSLTNTLQQACVRPAEPGELEWTNPKNIVTQMGAFTELMAATLACELSHVIAFQFGAQGARNRLPEAYGVPSSPVANSGDSGPAHHPWTHQGSSETKNQALSIFIDYYSEQVAQLIDTLKTTNDASGAPLLDSTVVLWMSELGGHEENGDHHQTSSVPAVLFGNGQGSFKTGRYIRGPSPELGHGGEEYKEAGRDSARLLISIAQYMGLEDVDRVGASDARGPLELLYA